MLKHFVTIYLPMVVVISVAIIAGRQLYFDNDTTLNDVEFVAPVESQITDAVDIQVEAIHELPLQGVQLEDAASLNTSEAAESEETEIITEPVIPQAVVTETAVATETVVETEAETESVVVTVSGPGITKRCVVDYAEQTVHRLMQQASSECNFSYVVKDFTSLGAFVDELGGVASSRKEGKYWIYYVNGKKANVGVSSYTIAADDLVAWVYEQEY